jgi:hypothetical protein
MVEAANVTRDVKEIAGYAVAAKKAPDDSLLPLLSVIEHGATGERNFVKKG